MDTDQSSDVDKAGAIARSLQELFHFVEDLELQVKENLGNFQRGVDETLLPSQNESIFNSEFWILDD